jgi:uncharacterized protein
MIQQNAPKTVWLLLDGKVGHETQVVGLSQKMPWNSVEKKLEFNWFAKLPAGFLGRSLLSTTGSSRQTLEGPYPDYVIGMGRKIVPVAKWISDRSRGQTKVVIMGRKALSRPRTGTLYIGCAHFDALPRADLVVLDVPPTRIDDAFMQDVIAQQMNPMSRLKKPYVVALVGGPTTQHHFDAAIAQKMAQELMAAMAKRDGSVVFVTSPRTPTEVVKAFQESGAAYTHVWQPGQQPNPYHAYLVYADSLVVTGESESMIAEAASTGKALNIYALPKKPKSLKLRFFSTLRAIAAQQGVFPRLVRLLFTHGWFSFPRHVEKMHAALAASGKAHVFDGTIRLQKAKSNPTFDEVIKRLEQL